MLLPASRHSRAIVAFMLVLALVLAGLDTFFYLREKRNYYADLTLRTENELQLISAFVVEPMLRHEFSKVEEFLVQWGRNTPDVVELRALFPGGALLADFRRGTSTRGADILVLSQGVVFENQHLLDLEIAKDRATAASYLQRLKRDLLLSSVMLTTFVGLVLWWLVQTLAIRPLEREIGRRQRVEEELQKAHDQLETRVEERTSELLAAVEDLHREVIEREKAQQALAAEKERLAVTLRSIGDGVISTDIAGRVTLLNKVAEHLTGWPQAEAVGRHIDEVFHLINGESRERCQSPVSKVLADGQIATMCCRAILRARDGRERELADSAAPIHDEKSEMVGVVLVFRDETEKNRLEEELQKVKKLESVGVLAGGIAHDFNNILSAIMGNIELAAMLSDESATEPRALLAEAKKASLRAKELTGQLLTFAKGGEPVKKIAALAEVIRDSAEFVLRGSNVRCHYRIPDDLWPVVIDPGQISQVIQNIILNADQAMPEGGVIDIACQNLAGRAGDASDLVEIVIRDHGAGIPAGELEKIFDPYFTTKETGSGLGLAVTHSIISKHGGRITVKSKLGEGSTFILTLPASPLEKVAAPLEPAATTTRSGRILVMDDEEMVREIIQGMLTHLGYESVMAADGREALEKYREAMAGATPFDAVIMDLTVPGGMGGKEAAVKLRTIDPEAKIIVASGYSNDPIMAHPAEYGFDATLNKPFELAELAIVLKETV